jgi:hypothetical protein
MEYLMHNANPFLLWSSFVLLVGSIAALILGCLFRRPWVRRTGIQLSLWVSFVLGAIVSFWAFELMKKSDHLFFDGLTATLALLAIGFAIWQFRDSREQESRMKAFDKKMRSVADQMATRFAGNFPKNLNEINQVISKAEKTVDVMSDYVGYGHFSNPHQFNKYFRQLLDMPSRNIQVRMLVYARKEAEQMHETQFVSSDLKEPPQWAKLKEFCNRYENNFDSPLWEKIRRCDGKIKDRNEKMKNGLQPTEQESAELDTELNHLRPEFDRLMFDRQLMYIKDLLQHGVEIRKTGEKLPFFMWCEDGHEAVFTFLHETSKAEREVSFRTRDSRFVADSFEKKFEYLWSQKAARIELKGLEGHLEPDWLPESAMQAKGPSLVSPKAS